MFGGIIISKAISPNKREIYAIYLCLTYILARHTIDETNKSILLKYIQNLQIYYRYVHNFGQIS